MEDFLNSQKSADPPKEKEAKKEEEEKKNIPETNFASKIQKLVDITKKSREIVINALKLSSWDSDKALDFLIEDISVPAPPKVFKHTLSKREEKEAFKKIQQDPISSIPLLANIKVIDNKKKRDSKLDMKLIQKLIR